MSEHQFISFDGGIKIDGKLFVPGDKSVLTNTGGEGASSIELGTGVIPRGAGMSFVAASFGDGITSIDTRNLDRIAVLEHELKTVTVEAGVSVGVLLEYLVSHGYFLPILPGYPSITIGGCIAADVHGKNQARDGNFINQVEAFTLHHLDHGLIEVSRKDNQELFDLTIGGLGLTGTVVSVTLKVKEIVSPLIDMFVQPLDDIFALPKLLSEAAGLNDSVVTWHDFNQTGARFGEGFLSGGVMRQTIECGTACRETCDHRLPSGFEKLPGGRRSEVLPAELTEPQGRPANGIVKDDESVPTTKKTTFPIKQSRSQSPIFLTSENRGKSFPPSYCRMTTGIMNAFYHHSQALKVGNSIPTLLSDCYFPNKTLRDLYFHSFGRNGFFEHQLIVPIDQFSNYIEKIRWWLQRNDLTVTMASAKLFNGSKRLLRFNGPGICFALDFPRCRTAWEFLTFLDELTIETRSIPNIHKDSRLPFAVVEQAYSGEYHDFKSRLSAFDPGRKYQSELSRRLAL